MDLVKRQMLGILQGRATHHFPRQTHGCLNRRLIVCTWMRRGQRSVDQLSRTRGQCPPRRQVSVTSRPAGVGHVSCHAAPQVCVKSASHPPMAWSWYVMLTSVIYFLRRMFEQLRG